MVTLHYFPLFIVDLIVLSFAFFSRKKLNQLYKVLAIFFGVMRISFIPLIEHAFGLRSNSNVLDSFTPDIGVSQILTINPQIILYLLLPFIAGMIIDSLCNHNRILNYDIHPLSASVVLLGIFTPIVCFLFLNELLSINLSLRRYLLWTIPLIVIAAAMAITIWKSYIARLTSAIVLLLISLWPYIGFVNSTIKSDDSFQVSLKNYILKYDVDAGYWKMAVQALNNLDIQPSKIYVFTTLVEKDYLLNNEVNHTNLRGYLLSSVNSFYPLRENLLDSCVIVTSADEIDIGERNIVFIGSVDSIESTLHEMNIPVQYLTESKDKILYIP